MPSLFRLIVVLGSIAAATFGGLYALATYVEPKPHDVSKPIAGVKVRRP